MKDFDANATCPKCGNSIGGKVMSIFRDRIVLPSFGGEPTAIYPEQIKAVALLKPGVSPVPMCRIVKKDSTAYTVTVSDIRIDPPTGMVDSTGKEIFERDEVLDTIELGTGVIQMILGEWRIELDYPSSKYASVPLYAFHERFTITGRVPWSVCC